MELLPLQAQARRQQVGHVVLHVQPGLLRRRLQAPSSGPQLVPPLLLAVLVQRRMALPLRPGTPRVGPCLGRLAG